MRIQDAVPDELEIIPDGEESKHTFGPAPHDTSQTAAAVPIPKTVVQKVDPTSPSHGEVPGTAAYSIRKTDARPDVIVQVTDPEITLPSDAQSENSSPSGPVPETGIARLGTVSSGKEAVGEGGSNMRGGGRDLDSEEENSEMPSQSIFCYKLLASD